MSLFEKIQELIESEVQKELMKYAQVISKKHDISLKLLLQDIHAVQIDEPVQATKQCLGVTAKKTQCTFGGKHGGYCARHVSQRKMPRVVSEETIVEKNPHIGHTMKDCMFLAGCPACEKSRKSSQNLLIEF
jgi:hypothetical protein